MSIIDEGLSADATIASGYDPGRGKPPAPPIAIVTCADPRLTSIGQMLGLADGDADMIRNFGTVIDDDSVRSLVLSTRLLGSREIMIINHTYCGMLRFARQRNGGLVSNGVNAPAPGASAKLDGRPREGSCLRLADRRLRLWLLGRRQAAVSGSPNS